MSDARISAGQYAPGQAPRITVEALRKEIVDREFIIRGTLTICVLTLRNGTRVTGESACVYPENFDQAMGEKIAYDKAEGKVWALEGYLLAQHRLEEERRASEA